MNGGPRALLGTGPFVGGAALSKRGKDVSLRMGSRFYVPNSTTTAPTFVNTLGSGFGFGMDSVGAFQHFYAGAIFSSFNSSGISTGSGNKIGFSSTTTASAALSAFFTYQAGGVLNMGAAAASPVHQSLKGHNGLGTDIAGANQVIAGGAGTGTGRGGDTILKTHESTTTGATAQTAATVPRYQAVAKHVTLTEATATTICTFAVGSGKFIGVVVDAVVFAADVSDFQCQTSRLMINAVQKSGVITATITQVDGTSAASAGTLTPVTYTVVDAGSGNMTLKCNATSSLTQTTLECRFVVASYSGNGIEAITAANLITPA